MRFYILLLIFVCTSFSNVAYAIKLGSQEDLVNNVGDRIFFNSNRADIDSDAIELLDDQISWLKEFDYNKNLFDQIRDDQFTENDFLKYGENNIQTLTLNSIKDNKKFEIIIL